jgi:hypothetical protein
MNPLQILTHAFSLPDWFLLLLRCGSFSIAKHKFCTAVPTYITEILINIELERTFKDESQMFTTDRCVGYLYLAMTFALLMSNGRRSTQAKEKLKLDCILFQVLSTNNA